MNARDVIYEFVSKPRSFLGSGAEADALVERLTAAGYRILGPDDIVPVWAAMIAMVEDIHAAQDNLSSDEWAAAERICTDLTKIMDARSLIPEAPQPEDKEVRDGR